MDNTGGPEANAKLHETATMADETKTAEEQPTHGEKLVGKNFNPSGHEGIDRIKELSAELIDLLEDFKNDEISKVTGAEFATIAQEKVVTAQMWAVKAITFRG